ncbi:MAG: hypothetical protein PUD59_03635 [bacterium]|nr:hypothetical protein [bacterium]
MGVFDKLKNVFFEEEYVEVDEPVKKPKKEKQTIAKKVDLPEMPKIKEEKTARERKIEEEVVERVEKKGVNDSSLRKNFPMSFEDDDFISDSYVADQKEKENKIDQQRQNEIRESKIEIKAYGGTYDNSIYNSKKEDIKNEFDYKGGYEGKEYKSEQKVFRPTPIISPIYGILDKNYKKDEIVQKKEIRLSSASSKKVDLDSVREKAYGDLASDITASMLEEVNEKDKKVKDNNEVYDSEESLYDLNDTDNPVVSNVTLGDAEEYYKDLGLEYNVDYKENKLEKASGIIIEKNL